jgi:signal transduction histidine kinase
MDTSATGTGKPAEQANRPALSRWQHLLHLLVVFALFTVSLSLYLSHRYVQIYVQSVAVNQAWTARLRECSHLGRLAAGVNAPGNDVFQSHQVAAEEANLRTAVLHFNRRLDAFAEDLRANREDRETAALLDGVQRFRQPMERMAEEARVLFAHLRSDRTKEAGETMAAMDRQYALANQALEHLRSAITTIQERHLENQQAAATSLQQFQYVASTLILLLIGGSVAYGRRVRRQVEAATRAKEVYIQALCDSEADLDRRVRRRTAELLQANDSLRKEVDERRRAEEALRRSEDRSRALMAARQQLLQKLMSAQEDERRRIARDLHDEIGQALTSLLIGLRTVADAATLEAARGRVEDLRRIAVGTLEEVRRLARGLRPSVLDDLGLAAALERYAADYSQAHSIAVKVEADPDGRRLPGEVETALYRIAQEALTNTAKHATAGHVHLVVERQPAAVRLVVSDDGRGFRCPEPDAGGHLGLSGMRERAALLNGSVVVESDPDQGTRVSVTIPCPEENHGNH